ncbi:unnamed protein product, partial [Cuscuta epithymum]
MHKSKKMARRGDDSALWELNSAGRDDGLGIWGVDILLQIGVFAVLAETILVAVETLATGAGWGGAGRESTYARVQLLHVASAGGTAYHRQHHYHHHHHILLHSIHPLLFFR